MIKTPLTKDEHYRKLVIDFKGQALLRRCEAAVHVEAEIDMHFWRSIFHRYAPEKKYHFIAHSRSWTGSESSGVTQCLNFTPYLSKQFFICIDSDYRYLLQEHGIDIKHFIFQTYTYSIENHFCAAPGLDWVCEQSCGAKNELFDFELFLRRYSEVVYELFIWHIYAHITGMFHFDRYELNQFIKIRRNPPFPVIKNNGASEISIVAQQIESKLGRLQRDYPEVDVEPIKDKLAAVGVHPENLYLFLRGHDLFDTVVAIGRRVCEKLMEMKKKKVIPDNHKISVIFGQSHDFESHVKHNFSFGKYPEINKIGEDIRKFYAE
jgi:hypothetical protein